MPSFLRLTLLLPHKWLKIKTLIKNPLTLRMRNCLYAVINPFYCRWIYKSYSKKLSLLSPDTQLFLLGRTDVGAHLYLIQYVRLWQEARGKTCIAVLCLPPRQLEKFAKALLPHTLIVAPNDLISKCILLLFGEKLVYFHTLKKITPWLTSDRPEAISLFLNTEHEISNNYDYFKKLLNKHKKSHPPEFLSAYKKTTKYLDYKQYSRIEDYHLLNNHIFPKNNINLSLNSFPINHPYVVINIKSAQPQQNSYFRLIQNPNRYNCVIDFLIEKGYTVVLQGRTEQPDFFPRKGLINYAKSTMCSLENDLAIYANCAFMIPSKSGPESFATMFNIPILSLNVTELNNFIPSNKLRFYPKHLRNKQSGKYLSWRELFLGPSFFDMGPHVFQKNYEYIEMSEVELIGAVKEFIELLSTNHWEIYTLAQREFKEMLTPLHLDMYLMKGVPCDLYLSRAC